MANHTKVGILISCIILSSAAYSFAQQTNLQDISTPEFSKIDKDHNGLISSTEMQAYQADKFKELDKDNNGYLDAKELAADKTKMLQSADKNKDGNISQEESTAQFKQYFQEMDKNKDGQILSVFICPDTPLPYLDKYSTHLEEIDF